MKYWKQGFYDEPQEGSVEIEDDYYMSTPSRKLKK